MVGILHPGRSVMVDLSHESGPKCVTRLAAIAVVTPKTGIPLVSLNRLLVGCGTTPRRQSGYLIGSCLFIRVIFTMLPPHGHWLILP